ncbi:MAG TPA: hypothetical protein VGN98_09765 [Tianweitania sediminis]|jgi:hypothetical protein|nr:hypothetical protein [Tianweitania sediminis]
MSLRVVSPPALIVKPEDLAGSHTEAAAQRAIAAATRTLDGPNGWLGRCLGPQTLELTLDTWCGWNDCLPCGPVIAIESIKYFNAADVSATIDVANYKLHADRIWFGRSFSHPALGHPSLISIRYKAGYNGTTGAADGEVQTGDVPPEAIQAVILLAQHALSVGAENLFLRSVETHDVETVTYTISDAADGLVKRAVENLVQGLRVYSL